MGFLKLTPIPIIHEISFGKNPIRVNNQITSMESFHKGRNRNNRHDGWIFMMYFLDEFEVEYESVMNFCAKTDPILAVKMAHHRLSRIYHTSVWDYYKYIGYDWKKKKWL